MPAKFWLWLLTSLSVASLCCGFLDFQINGDYLLDNFYSMVGDPNEKLNENFKIVPGEECQRDCRGSKPKICHFDWTLRFFQTMSHMCKNCSRGNFSDCFLPECITADGFQRGFMSINHQLPGPTIIVCRDDQIIVDVKNEMEGTSTTIHWHGMLQKSTPFMDGVPFLTQCPIPHGSKFRYSFNAAESGTNLYHSHEGLQKSNGLYGSLIVKDPNDINFKEYDHDLPEHVIIVSDWMHNMAEFNVPGLACSIDIFRTLLINGKGKDKSVNFSPLATFNVVSGQRYRFRIINSANNVCPITVKIENHRMNFIAMDLSAVNPSLADTLQMSAGERFDFVINANQTPGHYWIRMRSIGACLKTGRVVEGLALLKYNISQVVDKNTHRDLPNEDEDYPIGVLMNSPTPGEKMGYAASSLKSAHYDKELVEKPADYVFHLSIGAFEIFPGFELPDDPTLNFVGTINNISMRYPSFPLLTQPEEINETLFCDENNKQSCEGSICLCLHRLKVHLNSIVELVLYDFKSDGIVHPIHLHGHQFIVTEMKNIKSRDEVFKPTRRVDYTGHPPIYKDTIIVPNPGFARIKFRADNPGFWFLHCHFEYHLALGMGLVLQVGEIDQMVKPPAGFPRCYNFQPKLFNKL